MSAGLILHKGQAGNSGKGANHLSNDFEDEKSVREGSTFSLKWPVRAEHIKELERLFELQKDSQDVVLDLQELRLADRSAVKFLARCESGGARLKTVPRISGVDTKRSGSRQPVN